MKHLLGTKRSRVVFSNSVELDCIILRVISNVLHLQTQGEKNVRNIFEYDAVHYNTTTMTSTINMSLNQHLSVPNK